MNKFLLIALLSLSLTAHAQDLEPEPAPTDASSTPTLLYESGTELNDRTHNPYKGHWLTTFGFETSKYEVPFSFQGDEKSFKPTEQSVTGGRIGFGREFYIGKGLATTSKAEVFYMGSLFTRAQNAAPEDENIEFASYKKTSTFWGVELAQSISYIFDMKTKNPMLDEWTYLTVEPFIEAGIGQADVYNSLNYKYNLQTVRENYRAHVSDKVTNARIGAGINFTSRAGFFLFLKATQNRYDVSDRKIKGAFTQNGGTETPIDQKPNDVKMDAVMVYALGGGYKF